MSRLHLLPRTPPAYMRRSGQLACQACGEHKAQAPRCISGHLIPQLCNFCLLRRADRLERARRNRRYADKREVLAEQFERAANHER